jgi:hypothetical protein
LALLIKTFGKHVSSFFVGFQVAARMRKVLSDEVARSWARVTVMSAATAL